MRSFPPERGGPGYVCGRVHWPRVTEQLNFDICGNECNSVWTCVFDCQAQRLVEENYVYREHGSYCRGIW